MIESTARAVRRLLACLALLALPAMAATPTIPTYGYEVVRSYPHDPNAFTQGLFFKNGVMYESTGLEGRSSIRKVRLETGEVLQKVALPAGLFGETGASRSSA